MQVFKIMFWVAVSPLIFYFIPTLIAYSEDDEQMWSIFWANLFFGWTGFGWIAALGVALYHISEKSALTHSPKDRFGF